MLELLFLLLPIAAAYGYYMGSTSWKNKKQDKQNIKTHSYLKGVDYLLNNESDRALDNFIDYLKNDDPSFETSLALGNLFRKRGEVDRAISLHEQLSKNQNNLLDDNQIEIIRLELAQDFISAGLLDRAEQILNDMIDIPRQRKKAALLLVSLYEQERDFTRSIEISLKHRDVLGQQIDKKIANYYCERAKSESFQKDSNKSISLYQSALDIDINCTRAMLSLAQIYVYKKDIDKALSFIHKIISLDRDRGMECLEVVQQCFSNKADPNYRKELELLVSATKSCEVIVELAHVIALSSNINNAVLLLTNYAHDNPNMKLFSALMEFKSKEINSVGSSESILQIKSLIDAQIASANKYSCKRCGFESKIMFYQCPSCRRWSTLKAIRGLVGD